jgi:hypothetical protein
MMENDSTPLYVTLVGYSRWTGEKHTFVSLAIPCFNFRLADYAIGNVKEVFDSNFSLGRYDGYRDLHATFTWAESDKNFILDSWFPKEEV